MIEGRSAGAPPRARIAVAGAGAVGSVVGGLLAACGHDVLLIGRDPHMAEIRTAGLQVTGLFGEAHTRPRTETSLQAGDDAWDLVLVAVKSHATEDVATSLAAWRAAARAPVVSLQNGLGNVERLEQILGPGRVLGARVIFGATLPRPGSAHVTVCAQPVAVGPLAPDPALQAVATRVAELLAHARVPCVAVDTVQPLLWEKVLYNCGLNPLGALHGLTYGEVVASPELRPVLDSAIGEGFEVARALGIGLRWPDAAAFREYFHTVLVPPTAAHRSSMRQDLEAGRLTEVEAISGAIVRAGASSGVPTPVNARLLAAIHDAERVAAARETPRRS